MPISRRALIAAPALPFANFLHGSPLATKLKIVFTGGHPGDPECGCAGTIARYTQLGHDVVLLYLNRGEAFCKSANDGSCGEIRSAEAAAAGRILGARPVFADQADGKAIVDRPHYESFRRLLDAEKPEVVFTQWPIDSHRDHRAVSSLVLDSWLNGGKKWALYYYEVTEDTMMFQPSEYVDIASVEAKRRDACYAHASQEPDKWYPGQLRLTRFRGEQNGVADAEAFLRHWQSKESYLPR